METLDDDTYSDNYLNFINNNSNLIEALQSKNLFVLDEHIIKLYNEILYFNKMFTNRIRRNEKKIQTFHQYYLKTIAAIELIESIDNKYIKLFKLYLIACSSFTLANGLCVYSNKKHYNYDKAKIFFERAYAACLKGQELQEKANFNAEEQFLNNILTLGKGMFGKFPFSTFEKFAESIIRLNIIDTKNDTKFKINYYFK